MNKPMISEEISVEVNGTTRAIAGGSTVAALLAAMGVEATRVAVERNHDVVPRKDYDQTVLAAGDHLEVVGFVGGG
jgi:thiamine biosynthesis protein ThiS